MGIEVRRGLGGTLYLEEFVLEQLSSSGTSLGVFV